MKHRAATRALEKFKDKARWRHAKEVVDSLNVAMEANNVGKFYQRLPRLGIPVRGKSKEHMEKFVVEDMRAFTKKPVALSKRWRKRSWRPCQVE
eukprot:11215592-Lingulodinium_polyedra.AAC.1